MGAQVAPAVKAFWGWLSSGATSAVITRTILTNVALGALEFDADGEKWMAIDE